MHSTRILPVVVTAQFLCTSVWFAGNGVAQEIARTYNLSPGYVAHLTSAVQIGFIAGTLLFAMLHIADRFSSIRVFFVCAVAGALANAGLIVSINAVMLLTSRLLVGFFLAGVYPVGMKIAADHFPKGLGHSLGLLVGALVIGTAFPHLLRSFPDVVSWRWLVAATSALSIAGGTAMLLLVHGNGNRTTQRLRGAAIFTVFKSRPFSIAAAGYFGHMWELYAFWAFAPVMLRWYEARHQAPLNVPIVSFCIIALGGTACVVSGYLSQRYSVKTIATGALVCSASCCFLSPLVLILASPVVLILFLFFWGFTVVADSPMFSSLVAHHAPADLKGTALTIVTSIGFAITVVSIQLLNVLMTSVGEPYLYVLLGLGPLAGIAALLRKEPARTNEPL